MSWGVVYFVVSGDRVKVGYTTQLRNRMVALATASPRPLRLAGTAPGSRELEQRCHEQLAPHRVYGEWFKRGPALALLEVLTGQPVERRPQEQSQQENRQGLSREAASYRRRLRETEAELERVRAELSATRAQLGQYQLTIFEASA